MKVISLKENVPVLVVSNSECAVPTTVPALNAPEFLRL